MKYTFIYKKQDNFTGLHHRFRLNILFNNDAAKKMLAILIEKSLKAESHYINLIFMYIFNGSIFSSIVLLWYRNWFTNECS